MLNIAIFGTGALGSLFASRLTKLANVTMIGTWQSQINRINQQGLTVTELDGQLTSHIIQATGNISYIAPVDVAIVLVKSYQTARVAPQIVQLLKLDGIALTLQNGLGNAEILKAVVGNTRVVSGITAQGATMLAPGQVRYAGQGPTYIAKQAHLTMQLEHITTLLNQANLKTELVTQANRLVWGKLAINAAINPLTALFNVPNGDLMEDETLNKAMIRAAEEVVQVAIAQQIQLPYPDVAEQLRQVCRATATNRSSMLQDIDRGSRTEIEAICGAVVTIGKTVGVKTWLNELLYDWVKLKETDALEWTPTELKERLAFSMLVIKTKSFQ